MIRKQVLEDNLIKAADSSLLELKNLIEKSIERGTKVIQLFDTAMHENGISMSSSNEIDIELSDISIFKDNLIININNGKLSMAVNEKCKILIQRPEPNNICKIYFEDFEMWLLIR